MRHIWMQLGCLRMLHGIAKLPIWLFPMPSPCRHESTAVAQSAKTSCLILLLLRRWILVRPSKASTSGWPPRASTNLAGQALSSKENLVIATQVKHLHAESTQTRGSFFEECRPSFADLPKASSTVAFGGTGETAAKLLAARTTPGVALAIPRVKLALGVGFTPVTRRRLLWRNVGEVCLGPAGFFFAATFVLLSTCLLLLLAALHQRELPGLHLRLRDRLRLGLGLHLRDRRRHVVASARAARGGVVQ